MMSVVRAVYEAVVRTASATDWTVLRDHGRSCPLATTVIFQFAERFFLDLPAGSGTVGQSRDVGVFRLD